MPGRGRAENRPSFTVWKEPYLTDDLVMQIQQGHNELLPELWEERRRLIAMWAAKFYTIISAGRAAPGGVEVDDLVQCGYFALVEAVAVHNPELGPFNAILSYYCKKHFHKAIGRTEKQRREPLNNCASLDVPVSEDGDETLLDFIPDSRDPFTGVEERIYQEQLHKALEAALSVIPTAEADCIRAEFFEGRQQAEIAARMGLSQQRTSQLRNGGLRHIRNSSAKANLERFLDSETPFFKKVGVATFNTTHTSAVEAVMLYRERRRAELGKSLY